MESAKPRLLTRDLAVRLLTGFIVGPLVLALIVAGGLPYSIGLVVMVGLSLSEWYFIVRAKPPQSTARLIGWLTAGALYVCLSLGLFWGIRQAPLGLSWVLTLILANWATDSFAYIGGHLFGKHPLAPSISPHKTVEGALSGIGLAVIVTVLVLLLTHSLTALTLGIVLLTSPASVIGDLIESAFKRHFGVKDSGRLLPGHGGMLDRIDGLLLACLVVGLFLAIAG